MVYKVKVNGYTREVMSMELAWYVQKRRQKLGIKSQTELSRLIYKKTGVPISHATIAHIEKGVDPRSGKIARPKMETLKLLAEGLNVQYEFLLEKAGYNISTIPYHHLCVEVEDEDELQDLLTYREWRREQRLRDAKKNSS